MNLLRPFPQSLASTLGLGISILLGLATTTTAAETDISAVLKSALGRRTATTIPDAAANPMTPVILDPLAEEIGTRLSGLVRARRAAAASSSRAASSSASAAWERRNSALDRLASSRPGVLVYLRDSNGTVSQIRGTSLADSARAAAPAAAAAGDLRERIARHFVSEYPELFLLSDPESELVLVGQSRDDLGRTRLRFVQQSGGVPVWPANLDFHFDDGGELTVVEGAYVPSPDAASIEGTLAATAAIAKARAVVPGGWAAEVSTPERIIFASLDAVSRPGWRMDLNLGFSQSWRVVVDAGTGRVLHRSTRIYDGSVKGSGVDMKGQNRALNVWQDGNNYFLIDSSKPSFKAGTNPVQKPEGAITIADARGTPIDKLTGESLFLITSSSPTSWNVAPGVSAAFNFSETYDYYLQRHNRNSLDGNGGSITAVVRVGGYANASWNGNLGMMFFGDVEAYAASLDVIGHELTHGVTEKTAGLVYELQPGAMNEAFSDIFGEMVEARTRGQTDWRLGSDMAKYLRDMKNPGSLTIEGLNKPYPSKMSEFLQLPNADNADHGGVHLNSSIINHAFYQLAQGLPDAVGLADAERIFYRALTQHLQAQSQFVDCRLACEASAAEIFGPNSAQARATGEAFDLVEIYAAPKTPAPPPVPVVQGADSTLFVFDSFLGTGLGRRETAAGDGNGGTLFALGTKVSRPAVTGDGSEVLFVNNDYDLCDAETADGRTAACIGYAGFVHAVAISPDGKHAAFVLRDPASGQAEGSISVVNLSDNSVKTYSLVAPGLDGIAVDQILYADAMAFSTDGTELIYDALSKIQFGNGPTVFRWSIFALNVQTDVTQIVVPPVEGIDTGNPSMGRAGNRYLTFDAQLESGGYSLIVVLDLFTGEVASVGSVVSGLGYPCFTGDESAIIYASPDLSSGLGFSLVRQPLTADRLHTAGDPSLWLTDALLGVVYRRGSFVGQNALPTVALVPSATDLILPGAVTLTATASDSDGTVAKVEFFDGSIKLGESAVPSGGKYTFAWNNPPIGTHRVLARATDNLGGAGDSPLATLNVRAAGSASSLKAAVLAGGGIRLAITGAAGNYRVQQSPDLAVWTDSVAVTIGAAGVGTVDFPASPGTPKLYFRARSGN